MKKNRIISILVLVAMILTTRGFNTVASSKFDIEEATEMTMESTEETIEANEETVEVTEETVGANADNVGANVYGARPEDEETIVGASDDTVGGEQSTGLFSVHGARPEDEETTVDANEETTVDAKLGELADKETIDATEETNETIIYCDDIASTSEAVDLEENLEITIDKKKKATDSVTYGDASHSDHKACGITDTCTHTLVSAHSDNLNYTQVDVNTAADLKTTIESYEESQNIYITNNISSTEVVEITIKYDMNICLNGSSITNVVFVKDDNNKQLVITNCKSNVSNIIISSDKALFDSQMYIYGVNKNIKIKSDVLFSTTIFVDKYFGLYNVICEQYSGTDTNKNFIDIDNQSASNNSSYAGSGNYPPYYDFKSFVEEVNFSNFNNKNLFYGDAINIKNINIDNSSFSDNVFTVYRKQYRDTDAYKREIVFKGDTVITNCSMGRFIYAGRASVSFDGNIELKNNIFNSDQIIEVVIGGYKYRNYYSSGAVWSYAGTAVSSSITIKKDAIVNIYDNEWKYDNSKSADYYLIKLSTQTVNITTRAGEAHDYSSDVSCSILGDLYFKNNNVTGVTGKTNNNIISALYSDNGSSFKVGGGIIDISGNTTDATILDKNNDLKSIYANITDNSSAVLSQNSGTIFNKNNKIEGVQFSQTNGCGHIINNWTTTSAEDVDAYQNIFSPTIYDKKNRNIKIYLNADNAVVLCQFWNVEFKFDKTTYTNIATQSIIDGGYISPVTSPDDPKDEGRRFIGWSLTENADKTDVLDLTTYEIKKNTTLYATFKKIGYIVIFTNDNDIDITAVDGDIEKEISFSETAKAPAADRFTKENSEFAYFEYFKNEPSSSVKLSRERLYAEQEFSALTDVEDEILYFKPIFTSISNETTDPTLTAEERDEKTENNKSFNIIYNANGGVGEDKNVKYYYDSESYAEGQIFTRKGYDFLGWNTDPNATDASIESKQELYKKVEDDDTNDTTLYAIWKKWIYIVSFVTYYADSEDKKDMKDSSRVFNVGFYDYEEGEEYYAPHSKSFMSYSNRTFAYYKYVKTIIDSKEVDTKPNKLILYAGEEIVNLTTVRDANFYYIPVFTKDGDNDIDKSTLSDEEYKQEKTEKQTYKIIYHSNNGTGKKVEMIASYSAAQKIISNPFTYEGYTFKGYGDSAKSTKAIYQSNDELRREVKEGTLELYAIWAGTSNNNNNNNNNNYTGGTGGSGGSGGGGGGGGGIPGSVGNLGSQSGNYFVQNEAVYLISKNSSLSIDGSTNNKLNGQWYYEVATNKWRYIVDPNDIISNPNIIVLNGYLADGLYMIGSEKFIYSFDALGYLEVGLINKYGKIYYAETSGNLLGAIVKGERVIDGLIYNFNDLTAEFMPPADNIYKVANGESIVNPETNAHHYFVKKDNGELYMLTNGMYKIKSSDGQYYNYYFDIYGNIMTGLVTYNNKQYYMGADGREDSSMLAGMSN